MWKTKLIFFLFFSIAEIRSRILSEIAANAHKKRNLKNFKFFFSGDAEEEEKS